MIPAKVKNWPKFQHYRHRAPTWIKLHRALLDDFKFVRLPTVAKAVLPLVWLLAAEGENDGNFDADPEYLAFRFRMPEHEVAEALAPLVNQGFIELSVPNASALLARCRAIAEIGAPTLTVVPTERPALPAPAFDAVQLDNQSLTDAVPANASDVLATRYQPARPETERETENREEQSRSVGNTAGRDAENGAAPAAVDPGAAVAHQLPAKGGELVVFTVADVLELAELYPLVDVDSELRQIRGWLIPREDRRKVGRKGTRRMVATWLGKEQRRLADASRTHQTPKAPSAVGRTFDADEHRAQGSGFWLDPQPSTETDE